jgi:hypothetical protein
MTDKIDMSDLGNPDRVPTREESMDHVMGIFGDELTGLLGNGALKHQVLVILRPLLAELMSTVGNGIAEEIADRFGVKANICYQTGTLPDYVIWREAEALARTHIETGGGEDDGATDSA